MQVGKPKRDIQIEREGILKFSITQAWFQNFNNRKEREERREIED